MPDTDFPTSLTDPFQPEFDQIQRGIQVALGEIKADLLLKNVSLVNVFTEEIYPADVLISGQKIVAVLEPGTGKGEQVLDCQGLFAVPGLIDGHVHIESHALSLRELARLIVPLGVTTLLADPHEIANVSGMEGIRVLLQDAEKMTLRVFLQIPARVPTAPGVETTGGTIGLAEVKEMLTWPNSISLGELDPSKVVPPLPEYIAKIIAARNARLITNGHAAELTGRHLNAYISAGIYDDHEGVSAEGALERARLGMVSIAREGTLTHNLAAVLGAVTEFSLPTDNIIMCTDDKLPHEVATDGDIDYNVRLAIRLGVPAIKAIQMATINTARHFHLDGKLGSVAPGRLADIVLLSSLAKFKVEKVIFDGQLVADHGRLLIDLPQSHFPEWSINSVHFSRPLQASDFLVSCPPEKDLVKVRVIDMTRFEETFTKLADVLPVEARNGLVPSDPLHDLLKIAVVERHKKTGNIGLGFVKGFGLKEGALASSVSHDHHNIVVIGAGDYDMATAVNHLYQIQGGFCAVRAGRVLASVPLRFGGLMSIEPFEQTIERLNQLDRVSRDLGCKLTSPIMALLGISLPTIPEIGITDLGIICVDEINRVPYIVDLLVPD
jgi:adenine deaminase